MSDTLNNMQLSRIVLKGFKSIADCSLELKPLNILIGANGAGKSNFIELFKMFRQLLDEKLQVYVSRKGGPDSLLHYGRKKTDKIEAEFYFGDNGYQCTLEPTEDNRLQFTDEAFYWKEYSSADGSYSLGSGHFESQAREGTGTGIDRFALPAIKQWLVYHFHDTGDTSYLKQLHAVNDNIYLRPDARNLAPYLYYLKQTHPAVLNKIVKTIRLAAPFFGDFNLRPTPANPDMIELEWTEKGEDFPFKAHHLSDGTLRFMCLATLLLQPEDKRPQTIVIDEPELGLHPYAVTLLASLLRTASHTSQIIVSTQSVELISEFEPEDLLVVDRKQGKSMFSRPDSKRLEEWLEEYSLGELWKKNLFGGRPI